MFVSFIVGCKIKALRAKTNTYIKTPVRGEEPVFVVTGRKEDVNLAKREILQAAEHFSQIRASRRNSTSLSLGPTSPTVPGHITKQVRVPYRVVGLVVGPKGATIKRIQQTTNTYIVTPSRDKEPVFEVTGLPDNVDKAKKEIEHHIALRTGGILDPTHPENGDSHLFNGFPSPLFSPASHTSFSAFLDHAHTPHHHHNHQHERSHSTDSYGYGIGGSNGSSKYSDLGSTSSPFTNGSGFLYDNLVPSPNGDLDSPTSSAFDPAPGSPAQSVWPEQRPNLPINRAVGTQPQQFSRSTSVNINGFHNGHSDNERTNSINSIHQIRRMISEPFPPETFTTNSSVYSPFSPTEANSPSVIPTNEIHQTNGVTGINGVNGINGINGMYHRDPSPPKVDIPATNGTSSDDTSNGSQQSSPGSAWIKRAFAEDPNLKRMKVCFVCRNGEVVAALIPCGHNLFCMECASKLKDDCGECPACQRKVEQVLRIFS